MTFGLLICFACSILAAQERQVRVVSEDGKAAGGAMIWVFNANSAPAIRGSASGGLRVPDAPAAMTDSDGVARISLAGIPDSEVKRYRVYVTLAHERGALVELADFVAGQEPVQVKLAPLETVRLQVRLGGRIQSGQRVVVSATGTDKAPLPQMWWHERTSSAGDVNLIGVPPGRYTARIMTRAGPSYFTDFVVRLAPSEPLVLTIGGAGRELRGRLIPMLGDDPQRNAEAMEVAKKLRFIASLVRTERPEAPIPRTFLFEPAEDLTFSIIDVPPGRYQLEVAPRAFQAVRIPPESRLWFEHVIEVPEGDGVLELEPIVAKTLPNSTQD